MNFSLVATVLALSSSSSPSAEAFSTSSLASWYTRSKITRTRPTSSSPSKVAVLQKNQADDNNEGLNLNGDTVSSVNVFVPESNTCHGPFDFMEEGESLKESPTPHDARQTVKDASEKKKDSMVRPLPTEDPSYFMKGSAPIKTPPPSDKEDIQRVQQNQNPMDYLERKKSFNKTPPSRETNPSIYDSESFAGNIMGTKENGKHDLMKTLPDQNPADFLKEIESFEKYPTQSESESNGSVQALLNHKPSDFLKKIQPLKENCKEIGMKALHDQDPADFLKAIESFKKNPTQSESESNGSVQALLNHKPSDFLKKIQPLKENCKEIDMKTLHDQDPADFLKAIESFKKYPTQSESESNGSVQALLNHKPSDFLKELHSINSMGKNGIMKTLHD